MRGGDIKPGVEVGQLDQRGGKRLLVQRSRDGRAPGWLDKGKVRSIRYRGPRYKYFLYAFVVSFLVLGYLGVVPTTVWGQLPNGIPVVGGMDTATLAARILTVVYFAFFILMPWYTAKDRAQELPEPERVTY